MNMEKSLQSMGLHQPEIIKNSLFDQINDLLSLWNPLDVPDYVAGTEYKDYVYEILDILKSGKDLESYIYNDIFQKALGLRPSESAKTEICTLCRSIVEISGPQEKSAQP